MNADAVATTVPTALSTSAVAISNLTRKVLDDTTSSSGKTEPLTPHEKDAAVCVQPPNQAHRCLSIL